MASGKSDHESELHRRMKELKARRQRAMEASNKTHSPLVVELMAWIRAEAEAFVAGDKALAIQSSHADQMFIGYGYIAVCQIEIATEQNGIRLDVHDQPAGDFRRSMWFTSSPDKDELKQWVRHALLDWYEKIG